MKLVKGNKIIEATEKAYRVIYKGYGYKPYIEDDVKDELVEAGVETDEVDVADAITHKDMKKAEIGELLDSKGIKHSSRDSKEKLIALLEAGD